MILLVDPGSTSSPLYLLSIKSHLTSSSSVPLVDSLAGQGRGRLLCRCDDQEGSESKAHY